MKSVYLVIIFCLLFFGANAQVRRSLHATRVEQSPKIDGEIDDEAWKQCEIASGFTQTIPSPDKPSLYEAEVRMCYTNTALYISAKLYQPLLVCSKQFTARDNLNNINADVFSVFLDTYDDHQNGFVFRVSSAGVQDDERLSNGNEYGDQSWDAVWTSRIACVEDGWQIEMEIPFSAIRFSKTDEMKWGINFLRSVRKINESSYWNKIDVQKQGFLAQTGMLEGLKNIVPPARLFFFPYVSTSYLQQQEASGTVTRWLKSGGLDIKYGLNESFTFDATLIPDFSQVISDNLVRNLSPFEQQLSENRPFFTEGTELFNKAEIFYTRRVGGVPSFYNQVKYQYGDTELYTIEKNPNVSTLYNAFKISGRNKKKVGLGLFNAVGAPMHAKIKDKKTGETIREETEPLTNYNVLVYDKAFKGQSSFNFTNTNVWRNGSARDANVSAFMLTQFNKKENYALNLFSKWSIVNEEKYNIGSSIGMAVSKVSGKLNYTLSAVRLSPNFDKSDMGIQFDFNNFNQGFEISYVENKPKAKNLQFYRMGMNHNFSENTTPFHFKYYEAKAFYFLLFKNFWDITFGSESKPIAPIDFYQLGSWGKKLKTYPYVYNSVEGSSDSRKKLFWAYYLGYGTSNEKHTGYIATNQTLRYRVTPKLDVSLRGEMTRDNNNIGFAFYSNVLDEPVVGSRDIREYTGELSLKYNLNPNTNLTARFRHYNSFITYTAFHLVDESGEWRNKPVAFEGGHDENYNLQNVDVFFNWMFRPGSRLVLSYKQWLNDAYLVNNRSDNSYFNNVHQILKTPHAFELGARVIFFLDYNKLKHS